MAVGTLHTLTLNSLSTESVGANMPLYRVVIVQSNEVHSPNKNQSLQISVPPILQNVPLNFVVF